MTDFISQLGGFSTDALTAVGAVIGVVLGVYAITWAFNYFMKKIRRAGN